MSGDSNVDMKKEIKKLRKKLIEQSKKITKNLSRWQRVELARHADRPHALDLIELMCDSWIELHGDRLFADDKRDKLIANKRKKTIKQVKYFFGRRVS